MQKALVAAVAAMAVLCGRAEAAVYTTTAASSFTISGEGPESVLAFVPSFNSSLGTLNTTTFTLTGFANSTIGFASGSAPTSGSIYNTVQFNTTPVTLSPPVAVTNTSRTATSIRENYAVNASATFGSSYQAAPGQPLDVTLYIYSGFSPQAFPSSDVTNFSGTLSATYDYTPVPEPTMASVLCVPLAGIVLARRRR